MKLVQTFILILAFSSVVANDSLLISGLLQRIADLQVKEDGIFPKGCIPSYRMYALNKDRYKADVNPFFSAVTSLALLDIMNELSPSQQIQAKAIVDLSKAAYPKFKNKKMGRDTYNFWPTNPPVIFPNSGWLNLFNKKQSIPDDLDDTVLLLMAQSAEDSLAKKVHTFMQSYRNGAPGKKINNTFKEYENIGAYETWFANVMPVDFEIGVFANVLLFVQQYNLQWTKTDSASLDLMRRMLEERKHITAANYIAPHYVRLSVILYHVSRLMAVKPIPELEKLKPQLIDDAKQALLAANDYMDQVLLSTSLLRWGVSPPDLAPHKANSLQEMVEKEGSAFFIANMASMLRNPYKQWVGAIGVGRFYYYCPAYNNILLIENLIWRRRRGL
jgi:hypothetical protein